MYCVDLFGLVKLNEFSSCNGKKFADGISTVG